MKTGYKQAQLSQNAFQNILNVNELLKKCQSRKRDSLSEEKETLV